MHIQVALFVLFTEQEIKVQAGLASTKIQSPFYCLCIIVILQGCKNEATPN